MLGKFLIFSVRTSDSEQITLSFREQKNYDSDGGGYGGAASGVDTKKSGNGGREVGFQPLMSLMLEKQGKAS